MANSIAYLAAEVYNVTRRPDLIAQTQQAIQTATIKLHKRNFYDKDMLETMVEFNNCCYTQQFPYLSLIPNWRALRYFKHPRQQPPLPNQIVSGLVSFNNITEQEFDIVAPNNIFSYAGFIKGNVAYLSGVNWNLRGKFAFKRVLCGYFVDPVVTVAGFSSWIADRYEFAVVAEASKMIFQQIGLDAEAAQQQKELFDPQTNTGWYQIIDAAETTGVGF